MCDSVPNNMDTPKHVVQKVRRTKQRYKAGLPWAVGEEVLLAELYSIHNNHELAVWFGRSEWAIIGKARSLGLAKAHGRGYWRRHSESRKWSNHEIKMLKELYLFMPYEEIAERLGRSLDAIQMKARKLKLRKVEFWSEHENILLKDLYRKKNYDQISHILQRTVPAVKARTITLKLENKVPNWRDHEINFLKKSYGRIKLSEVAKTLRRTIAATAKKAREIGLVQYRHWACEDIEMLKKLYPCSNIVEISSRIGRSCNSVRYKANQLGLHKYCTNIIPLGIKS